MLTYDRKMDFEKLSIHLPLKSDLPQYEQLYNALHEAIEDGRLKPGQRLPSSRDMAQQLNISRETVTRALRLLIGRGYIESHVRSRMRVRSISPTPPTRLTIPSVDAIEIPVSLLSTLGVIEHSADETDQWSCCSITSLPVNHWKRFLVKHFRNVGAETQFKVLGLQPLREMIATFLQRRNLVRCDFSNVVIFAGAASALDFIARLVLDPGSHIVAQDPGPSAVHKIFAAHGAAVHPISTAENGIETGRLLDTRAPIKLAYLLAHHYLTGAPMSSARRELILQWAASSSATIVEEGLDNEFYSLDSTVETLQWHDPNQSVIYVSSFERVLSPLTSLAFAVFPDRWLQSVTTLKAVVSPDLPWLEQRALMDLILEGYFDQHLSKLKLDFKTKSRRLALYLNQELGEHVTVSGNDSSPHLLVEFSSSLSEERIVKAARSAQLSLINSKPCFAGLAPSGQFTIPLAHVDESNIRTTVMQFAEYLWSDR